MVSDKPTADSIFLAAVELQPERRAVYLKETCGDNSELLARVERLLEAQSHVGSFLEYPAPELGATVEHAVTAQPGMIVGPYKLLQQIGEGGMGVVFMAEQTEPIQRNVALKIIKPGMDTRQVIARFEAERQALAMMDHPSIAKVLDAGTTDTGRPYFVMELVKGVPITNYCDEHKLSLLERLELFKPVCEAVQHAHQKGIIHRDIKPSNVLMAEYDNCAVPKVIDFGVAKATAQKLTERTMYTEFGQVIGTVEYMSPEQAKFNQLDIDTRSDIYSLGVLLYELLTGSTPFERQRLREAAFDEVLRIIREEEPPRPSTRLSTSETLPSIAASRDTEPAQLSKEVRGELDWIVMRSLEKDRQRRYPTASAFADDIQRYLTNKPVEARSASRAYRLKKFISRNKAGVLAGMAIVLTMMVGALLATWQAVRATRAEHSARTNEAQAISNALRAEAISSFLIRAFRSPDPDRDGRSVTIAEVLDRTVGDIEKSYQNDRILKAALLDAFAQTYLSLGLFDKVVPLGKEALQLRRQVLGESHRETLSTMTSLAMAYARLGQTQEGVQIAEDVVRRSTNAFGIDDVDTIQAMTALSKIYRIAEQPGKAIPFADTAADLSNHKFGPDAKDTIKARHEVAAAHGDAMAYDPEASMPFAFEDLLEPTVRQFGEDNHFTLVLMHNIGLSRYRHNKYDAARKIWERTLQLQLAKLGPKHSESIRTAHLLAELYSKKGDARQAVVAIDEILKNFPNDSELLKFKDYALLRSRSVEERAAIYAARIQNASNGKSPWSPRKLMCRELAADTQLFDTLCRLIPDESTLWIGRGQFYSLRGRFREAEADYARVIESMSMQDEHFDYGCLLLLCGDMPTYQEYCRRVLAKYGDSKDDYAAYVKARLFELGPAECIASERIIEWAKTLSKDRTSWALQTLGLANLRAGRWSDSITTYMESIAAGKDGREEAESWYGLAMAYHGLGKFSQAQDALLKGRTIFHELMPRPAGTPVAMQLSPWLRLNVIALQAEALLKLPPAAPPTNEPPTD